ncbi:MAG: Fe-S cluster assembly protein SufD [Propionibacteriaceae bacterium]|jgi:Fe-S cluster assembly protein SufD|nr:Fe-S cluster assembly protein SufD [Propionibacteriaceae bacterium]
MMATPTTNMSVSHLHPTGSLAIADHRLPSGKEEVWRFTPVMDLIDMFDPNTERGHLAPAVGGQSGITLGRLAVGQGPRGDALLPVDRAAAIAAQVDSADYLLIDQAVAAPIQLDITGHGIDQPTADHLVIEAKPYSSATVVLHYRGHARHIGNVEVIVGESAQLTVVSIQEWDRPAVHLGQHEALIGPGSNYRHITVSLGGDLVRLTNNVSYAGVGGEAQMLGVYFAQAGQHLEHRLFVDHNHPRGVSHVDYRGALQDRNSRSVWVGDVLIRPEAVGIETYEANKNLVLTDGCRVHAVPNLEIETGDIIGAGHSASTGRFDEEQLFYLMSRGISEAEARRLVVHGFFAAILNRISLPDVAETLMNRIDQELAFDKEIQS